MLCRIHIRYPTSIQSLYDILTWSIVRVKQTGTETLTPSTNNVIDTTPVTGILGFLSVAWSDLQENKTVFRA